MTAYYNEHDPKKAAWLRELITQNVIAPGDVDERSISDVAPADLDGYTQCHFFAGIGIWSYALRLAGWPDTRPAWTGSCPCQSFSVAGKGAGFDDERHLWPDWYWLIEQCRPGIVFGEQVASSDALAWLDLVSSDLEGAGYTVGALDLCAAGVGAPHRRQRLCWVAHADGRHASAERQQCGGQQRLQSSSGGTQHLGNAGGEGLSACQQEKFSGTQQQQERRTTEQPGQTFWAGCEWIYCRDGKYRPVEPGSFPLVNGSPERVLRLRGYGDGIVAPLAAEFIKACKGLI